MSVLCHIAGTYVCKPVVRVMLDEGGKDWSWEHFNFDETWAKTKGRGILIAVLDTGYDVNHPDFTGKIEDSEDFAGDGIQDENDHGTFCASCAAGVAENGFAVGVAPEASLAIYKVLGNGGSGSSDGIVKGIRRAAEAGARVVSMSLGMAGQSRDVRKALDYYYTKVPNGIVVAAAGNDGTKRGHPVGFPAAEPDVICVGAIRKDGRRAEFSSWDKDLVDVVGPGEAVIAAIRMSRGGLGSMSGTSQATPFVAGAAALWASANPTGGVEDFRKALQETSRGVGGGKAYNPQVGWGLVTPSRLVASGVEPQDPPKGEMWKNLQVSSEGNVRLA